MALAQIYSAIAGDVITAARWNNEFGNIYSNGTDVAFPATKSVSFAGFTLTLDAAGVSTLTSTSSTGFLFTVGSKSGAPSANGSLGTFAASTFTDSSTAISGTATMWTGFSIRTPTLAASAASVTTTNAASVYIEGPPTAGSNQTITNAWAVWVDNGNVRLDGNLQTAGVSRADGNLAGIGYPFVDELRLTLTTGLPVTTADVTGAGTLYLTPYKGTHISLYDGVSLWTTYSTAEISLALVVSANTPYDVFCYANAGVPTLEILVWTNDTTRATALAYVNGVLVKSGATTRRYIGTIFASGANTTEDSAAKRYVWNYYNRVARAMRVSDATASWNYTTDTYRQANNAAGNKLDFVVGVAEDAVTAQVTATVQQSAANRYCYVGIGLDAVTVAAECFQQVVTATGSGATFNTVSATYQAVVAAGRHGLYWLEGANAGVGTATWYGTQAANPPYKSGISGIVTA